MKPHHKIFLTSLALLLVVSCTTTKTKYVCGTDINLYPKHGQDSKLIEFTKIASMDTIPSIVEGTIISFSDNEPLVFGIINLIDGVNNYEVISDSSGKFILRNIAPGNYKLNS